jgi:glutamine amidotransferase
MVCIIDYGMGNLQSIQNKLKKINTDSVVSSDHEIIASADKLILPGVGHFATGIHRLRELNLLELLNRKVLIEKIPVLGICLGMQLITMHSEEGDIDGLGWIDAQTARFNVNDPIHYKIPHIGWNSINIKKSSVLYDDVHEGELFYFVHSYFVKCNNSDDILTMTTYEQTFVSSIQHENIFATQFHPEKSHNYGLKILENFVRKI